MKKVLANKIINIEGSDIYDSTFQFDVLYWSVEDQKNIEIVFLSDLLEERKNEEMLEKAQQKPACYSNVYSPKDELEIFRDVFERAIAENKKIHIVWITLKEEIELLEAYYKELGFFNDQINCFDVNFSNVLVSASVKLENIMWRWSDYKRMWKEIFFNPPIRESGQVKAMFKWINRGVTAWIYIAHPLTPSLWRSANSESYYEFFTEQILDEKILPITLAKVLHYNLESLGIVWKTNTIIIKY